MFEMHSVVLYFNYSKLCELFLYTFSLKTPQILETM